MDYRQIGLRIRTERKKLKITREKLAELLDLSINYLGQIERGEKKFSAETIVNIADSLHLSLDYLIRGEGRTTSPDNPNDIQSLLKRCSRNELLLIKDVIAAILPHIKPDRQ